MVILEFHHYLKRKTQGQEGCVTLKLDMSKAYDNVEWNFLRYVILCLKFKERRVGLIWECISIVHYQVFFEIKESDTNFP